MFYDKTRFFFQLKVNVKIPMAIKSILDWEIQSYANRKKIYKILKNIRLVKSNFLWGFE